MQTLEPLIPITLCLLAACSHGASTGQSGAGANTASTAAQTPGRASGGATITKDRGEALARKLGALCNKLFASH